MCDIHIRLFISNSSTLLVLHGVDRSPSLRGAGRTTVFDGSGVVGCGVLGQGFVAECSCEERFLPYTQTEKSYLVPLLYSSSRIVRFVVEPSVAYPNYKHSFHRQMLCNGYTSRSL